MIIKHNYGKSVNARAALAFLVIDSQVIVRSEMNIILLGLLIQLIYYNVVAAVAVVAFLELSLQH